jgi:hypothetical protein
MGPAREDDEELALVVVDEVGETVMTTVLVDAELVDEDAITALEGTRTLVDQLGDKRRAYS